MNVIRALRRYSHGFAKHHSPSVSHLLDRYYFLLKKAGLYDQQKVLTEIYSSDFDSSIKYDCANLMLQKLLKYPQFINIYDLRVLIDRFQLQESSDSGLKRNLVACMLHSFQNLNGKNKLYLANEISQTFDKLDITNEKLVESVDSGLLPVLQQVSDFSNRNLKIDMPSDDLDLSKYKTNGILDLEDLCKYIATPFPVENPGNQPLFEYYGSLSPEEKQGFLQKYLKFNKTKQIHIEENVSAVMSNVSKEGFINNLSFENRQSVNQWLTFAEYISDGDFLDDGHEYLVKLLPANVLVNMLIAKTLSATLGTGQDLVVNILKSLIFNFKRSVFGRHRVNLPSSDIELMKFFGTILSHFIDHCEVTVPNHLQDKEFGNKLFIRKLDRQGVKVFGKLYLNPYIFYNFKYYETGGDSLSLPMLCPPAKWTTPTDGGYLSNAKPVVTTSRQNTYIEILKESNKSGGLKSVFQTLDYLGSVGWCLNPDIMKVFNKTMQIKDQWFVNVPPIIKNLKEQKRSGVLSDQLYQRAISKRLKYDHLKKIVAAYGDNIIYLPHNVDFRGRVYTMVSVLSYHDEDLIRAFFQFWEPAPLGSNGLNWLKYHLAGLYGQDKLSYEDKLKFVDDNHQQILNSANNPFEESWWQLGDHPWQTLSLCFELRKIFKFKGPIEEYQCRIPITQDGTCNGLQHYATLARDVSGGKAVNLVPLPERQDIYVEVLNVMYSQLGDDEYDIMARKVLNRKLVKRSVMTQVYGVTFYGAQKQVKEELYDQIRNHRFDPDTVEMLNKDHRKTKAMIDRITQLIFSSINELFTNSIIIQQWLLHCTQKMVTSIDTEDLKNHEFLDLIKGHYYKPMKWTSVSGWPVLQLYFQRSTKKVVTDLQSVQLRPEDTDKIDIEKQLGGIAPNFIHSLDAVHLLWTAHECEKHSIPFVAVHDSFWTSIDKVDEMSKILRRTFIDLHSIDLLEHFYTCIMEELKHSYHVAWISRNENPELVRTIDTYRGKGKIRDQLNREIRSRNARKRFQALVEEYKPKLYMHRTTMLWEYDNYVNNTKVPLKIKDFVPIIIKASIPKPPKTGDLDITQIVNSQHFFS